MPEQMKNNTVAFIFEGKLDDLLTDNGNIKSSRLIKFGNETEYGSEQNWDIQLTSYNNIEPKHEKFDQLLGKKVRIIVETIL